MSGKRQKQNAHEAHKLQNTWAVADLREDVEKDLVKHELSQMHFRARQFCLFTIPQAILTLLSSVLALEEKKSSDPGPNTFEWIGDQQRQFLAGCKSRCPIMITDAFDALDSKLEIRWHKYDKTIKMCEKELDGLEDNEDKKKADIERKIEMKKEKIKRVAVDILSTEIQNYFLFPMVIPSSKTMVNNSLKILEDEMKEGEDV